MFISTLTEQNENAMLTKVIPSKRIGNTQAVNDCREVGNMKLSTKGRYGLRALIDLAQYSGQVPVSITSISARQDISERYLEQLMAMLKKAGLVRSVRGAGGGYVLAKEMGEISVGDILRALEGSLEPVECPGLEPEGECKAADSCVTKYVWKRINESINQTVDEIMLDQLVRASRMKNCGESGERACKS